MFKTQEEQALAKYFDVMVPPHGVRPADGPVMAACILAVAFENLAKRD